MKELTIEEKAQRYDEAIETARKINSGEGVIAPRDWTIPEVIFHELRESEDERIRKAILEHIQLCTESIPDRDKFINWLEKQGNQKVTLDFKAKDWYVSKVDCKIHNIYGSGKSALEAIKEENPDNANRIEPKFKTKDWVIITTEKDEHTVEIIDVTWFRDGHPMYITSEGRWFGNGTKARLWSLQDAKYGDILAFDDETIVIFKDLYNATTFHSYCYIQDGVFNISEDETPDWWEGKHFRPATKEQCEILFQKMKEAGYKWNVEKKELKKINQNTFVQKCFNAEYERGKNDAVEKKLEEEFHNNRIAFYIDKEQDIVYINKGQSHEDYFNKINHPEYINSVVRGYILNNHIVFYKGLNFEVPIDFNIKTILRLSSVLNDDIKWIGLGCIKGKIGEEWTPQIVIKINNKNIIKSYYG